MRIIILLVLLAVLSTACDNPNKCTFTGDSVAIAVNECKSRLKLKEDFFPAEDIQLLNNYVHKGKGNIKGKTFEQAIREAGLWNIQRLDAKEAVFKEVINSIKEQIKDQDSANFTGLDYDDSYPDKACVSYLPAGPSTLTGNCSTGQVLLFVKKEEGIWKIKSDESHNAENPDPQTICHLIANGWNSKQQ